MRASHANQLTRTVALVAVYQVAVATSRDAAHTSGLPAAAQRLLRVHFAAVAHPPENAGDLAAQLHDRHGRRRMSSRARQLTQR